MRLVSTPNSLLTGKINREFRKFRASAAISASNQRANSKACSQIPYAREQGNFAAITGNFFGITGKFNRASRESADLLSDLLALLRHSQMGGLPAFGGRAGAEDIAGNAPELAVERRRSSYSPLLLSPAIGQRAGELCEGEIGRRGAVEQCRHDPG